jgi:hypothetical protein
MEENKQDTIQSALEREAGHLAELEAKVNVLAEKMEPFLSKATTTDSFACPTSDRVSMIRSVINLNVNKVLSISNLISYLIDDLDV